MLPIIERQPAWAVWGGGALAAVVLTVVAYTFVVVPTHERQLADDEADTQTTQQQTEADTVSKQLRGLSETLREKTAELEAQPLALGDRTQLNRQIASLIELAQHHGLEVLQLQPGNTMPGEHYDMNALRLEAQAAFPDHLAFLEGLHGAFPSVSVVGLDLSARSRQDAPKPSATFHMIWYTQVEQATLSAAPAAAR